MSVRRQQMTDIVQMFAAFLFAYSETEYLARVPMVQGKSPNKQINKSRWTKHRPKRKCAKWENLKFFRQKHRPLLVVAHNEYFESIFYHLQIPKWPKLMYLFLFIAVSTNKPDDISGMSDNRTKNFFFAITHSADVEWGLIFFFNLKCGKQNRTIFMQNRQYFTFHDLKGSLITFFAMD